MLYWADIAWGLSPRGRGKPGLVMPVKAIQGSIPAWAGETYSSKVAITAPPVYPRVGGGNTYCGFSLTRYNGLSPRGRGKRRVFFPQLVDVGSIPAWAGETQTDIGIGLVTEVYPRVGGGNGNQPAIATADGGLSPRGRGKLVLAFSPLPMPGSIPAWAGETCKGGSTTSHCKVYPRVGGGNGLPAIRRDVAQGLSPRGRGKH